MEVAFSINPTVRTTAPVVTLEKGTAIATGFTDCIVFNAEARCAPSEVWVGKFGRSVRTPRTPACPGLREARERNRARTAVTQGRPAKVSKHLTAEELSELLEQYRDTLARCVSVALREKKIPRHVDRREIEHALLVELEDILRDYRPRHDATMDTYVWGCLNKRVKTVISRETILPAVSLDRACGYPEGDWRPGARVSPAPGADDSKDRIGWGAPRQRAPVSLWLDRANLKLSIKLAEGHLDPTERRVFDLYHRRDRD